MRALKDLVLFTAFIRGIAIWNILSLKIERRYSRASKVDIQQTFGMSRRKVDQKSSLRKKITTTEEPLSFCEENRNEQINQTSILDFSGDGF